MTNEFSSYECHRLWNITKKKVSWTIIKCDICCSVFLGCIFVSHVKKGLWQALWLTIVCFIYSGNIQGSYLLISIGGGLHGVFARNERGDRTIPSWLLYVKADVVYLILIHSQPWWADVIVYWAACKYCCVLNSFTFFKNKEWLSTLMCLFPTWQTSCPSKLEVQTSLFIIFHWTMIHLFIYMPNVSNCGGRQLYLL